MAFLIVEPLHFCERKFVVLGTTIWRDLLIFTSWQTLFLKPTLMFVVNYMLWALISISLLLFKLPNIYLFS